MIPSQLICQMFTLPQNCDFVVSGIQYVTETQKMLEQAGRKDVRVRSEYWVEDLQWIYDKKPAPVVLDLRFNEPSSWMSTRFLAAREVLRKLGRTA